MALEIVCREKQGSVGAVWPPRYDERNDRTKGFYDRTVRSQMGFDRMHGQIAQRGSRTTIRAFMEKGLVEGIDCRGMQIEAVLDAGNAIAGHDLIYFGMNSDSRLGDREVFCQELESVRRIAREVDPVDRFQALERVRDAGFAISRLRAPTEQDIRNMAALYNEAYQEYTFEINDQSIRDMISNGNICLVGRKDGEIVSAMIAEHVKLEIGRFMIEMYELSDYATFRKDRGHGLITLMQIEAIGEIRKMSREAIVYAEGRAPWIAVNRSLRKAGLEYCGTLRKHCTIMSDRDFHEVGSFENLNVWYHQVGENGN